MGRLLTALTVLFTVSACGSILGLGDHRVPATGQYSYRAEWRLSHQASASLQADHFPVIPGRADPTRDVGGRMEVVHATQDSLRVLWHTDRYEREAGLGQWHEGAYLVLAQHEEAGAIVHRIGPGPEPGKLRCSFTLPVRERRFGDVRDKSCEITR